MANCVNIVFIILPLSGQTYSILTHKQNRTKTGILLTLIVFSGILQQLFVIHLSDIIIIPTLMCGLSWLKIVHYFFYYWCYNGENFPVVKTWMLSKTFIFNRSVIRTVWFTSTSSRKHISIHYLSSSWFPLGKNFCLKQLFDKKSESRFLAGENDYHKNYNVVLFGFKV